MEKIPKEPQQPLKRLFRMEHFGQLIETIELMEEPNDVQENDDVPIENDKNCLHDIID
jgi:hypothetical protein